MTYPVALVDLALTLAGIGQGVPLLDPRDSAYLEMETTSQPNNTWSGGAWRAVVTDDGWKLALGQNNARVMYDLWSDPYELAGLAGQRESLVRTTCWHACGSGRRRPAMISSAEGGPFGVAEPHRLQSGLRATD